MKKIIVPIILLAIIISITGCGTNNKEKNNEVETKKPNTGETLTCKGYKGDGESKATYKITYDNDKPLEVILNISYNPSTAYDYELQCNDEDFISDTCGVTKKSNLKEFSASRIILSNDTKILGNLDIKDIQTIKSARRAFEENDFVCE